MIAYEQSRTEIIRMNNKITVEIKNVYGKDLIYPVCEKAKKFALIADAKTLARVDISNIKYLGFEVVVQAPTL